MAKQPRPSSGQSNARYSTDELIALLYDELRTLASKKLAGERTGMTLQTTDLVHEVFLRLSQRRGQGRADAGDQSTVLWAGRTQFFAAAAEAMRRILIENARRKRRAKRGGRRERRLLEDATITLAEDNTLDVLALDEALAELETESPDKAQLVKLRFFTGLSIDDAADVLGISRATAKRRWIYARAWLYRRMQEK